MSILQHVMLEVCHDNQENAGEENMQIRAAEDECGEPVDKVKMMVDVQKVTDDCLM